MSKKICLVALVALFCCSASAVAWDVVGMPAAEQPRAEFGPIQGVAGHWTLNYATGKITPGAAPLRAEVVYDNTTTATGFGLDDPNMVYYVGDSLWMAHDGVLDSFAFSVYNSLDSAGPLSRVDVEINFYGPYDVLLGTVTLNDLAIDPALNAGEAGFFTVTDLQGLAINLGHVLPRAGRHSPYGSWLLLRRRSGRQLLLPGERGEPGAVGDSLGQRADAPRNQRLRRPGSVVGLSLGRL